MTINAVFAGILLPVEVLNSEWFAILAGFVAVNTLVYFTLAVAKMLPRIYFGDFLYRARHRDHRRASRSIYPDEHATKDRLDA